MDDALRFHTLTPIRTRPADPPAASSSTYGFISSCQGPMPRGMVAVPTCTTAYEGSRAGRVK